jgi:integrase
MTRDTELSDRIRVGDRVTIYRRGKRGTYTAEFWHQDQHHRRSLRTINRKVAVQRAVRIDHDLAQGHYTPRPPVITLGDAVERYLRCLETEGRARKTLVRYKGELEALCAFVEGQGVTRLSGLTLALFDDFRGQRRRDHARVTMFHEGIVAKQLMKWCISRGLLSTDPLANYKLTKPRLAPKPAPTLSQVNAILGHCSPAARIRVSVLAFSGMRVGELQGLPQSDVDLKAGFIDVIRQINGPTKTKDSRRIPIHRRIEPIIEAQFKNDSHELLFTAQPSRRYPNGGHHINSKRLNDDFKAAVAKAKLKSFTLHSLRHFFNTHCINNRVPERVVRAWMGHRDRTMTGVYYDLTDDESRRFMDAVSFEE